MKQAQKNQWGSKVLNYIMTDREIRNRGKSRVLYMWQIRKLLKFRCQCHFAVLCGVEIREAETVRPPGI